MIIQKSTPSLKEDARFPDKTMDKNKSEVH